VAIFLPLVVPLLAVLGTWKDITRSKSLKIISLGSLLFVTLISFQGHKEWRFVAYVIPVVNLAAANGASYLTAKASKSLFYKFVILGILSSTFISLALSVTWAHVSSFNYPGGFAITAFHEKILTNAIQNNASDIVTVHFDVPTAMTGATKFNELVPTGGVHVIYDKTEDPTELATLWDSFDYLITEVDLERDHSGKTIPNSDKYHWNLLDFTEAYEGIDRKAFKTLDPVRVVVELIQKKNLDPIGKAVYPFLRLKKALFIYEKVEN
jgi:alpha-1,6-mannosyltransferase